MVTIYSVYFKYWENKCLNIEILWEEENRIYKSF